ncbi:MAG TPA: PAS domain-containing protein, partial [Burkholderiales bacterium]|nr:PAS domain-containing protein [Burkholderiales bacterium]
MSALSSLFGDWYWEMDGQLRLTQTSPQFTEKTGLDPADDFWEHNRRSLERHEPFRDFEIQRLAPGGRTVWLSLSGVPVFEQDVFKG